MQFGTEAAIDLDDRIEWPWEDSPAGNHWFVIGVFVYPIRDPKNYNSDRINATKDDRDNPIPLQISVGCHGFSASLR